MKSRSIIIWTCFMALFFVFLYFFNTTLEYSKPGDMPEGIVFEKAKVIKINSEDMGPDPDYSNIKIGKQKVKLEILSGTEKGRVVSSINFVGRVDNRPVKNGSKVVISSYDDFVTTSIVNYSRETKLYILLLAFLFIVVFFGRLKGIRSIFALIFSIICIIFLFIPMIIRGVTPMLAAIIIVIISTVVSLLSINGWCKKTSVAVVSCIACTILAGAVASVVGMATHISTYNSPEIEDLLYVSMNTPLKIPDLIFAGVLISSLGAIMDTTMSIASAVSEIKVLNPDLGEKQLLKSGMNVGKDVMGTMTNTLILAFTGSSLNTLILLFMYDFPFIQLINLDSLVIEIVQGLSGSIAVILCIPITAFLSARVFCYSFRLKKSEETIK